MSRNVVFVSSDIRAIKLQHMSGGVFLRIDTDVILISDVMPIHCLNLAEIKGCQGKD